MSATPHVGTLGEKPLHAALKRWYAVRGDRIEAPVDGFVIDSPEALVALLPSAVPPRFTTAELAEAVGRHRRLAQQMTYCLRRAGVIEMVGKERNAIVYSRTDRPASRPGEEH